MANVLNALIKLTDYPFVYSLMGLYLLVTTGHGIVDVKNFNLSTFGPLITLMGLAATTLSITDPVGNIIRFILQQRHFNPEHFDSLNAMFKNRQTVEDPIYLKSITKKASVTSWMSYQIDKNVSIFYFFFILFILLIVLIYYIYYQAFSNNLIHIFISPDNSKCIGPIDCKDVSVVSVLVAMGSVGFILYRSIRSIKNYNNIVALCFYSQEVIIPSFKDHMGPEAKGQFADELGDLADLQEKLITSLNNRDWGMADFLKGTLQTSALILGEKLRADKLK